ncbi:hypothetical protein [Massilibacteroides vaginae]|uniref:hypothetical protein n=1 Tax=Massilibacteroides vaginae TaxID=1673718 RepID=UPI000A1CD4D4|nr:hypothetical protein [Massilibacteroides vaginae]
MKKFYLLSICLAFMANAKAQFPVTDLGNLFMKALDYIEFSSTATSTVDNLKESKKIFEQGQEYYDALKDVHSIVKKSRNVEGCIKLSTETVVGYQTTYSKVMSDKNFTSDQINVYRKQQENIISAIAKNIEGLNNVIVNTGMSIPDKDRLDAIDTYHARILALHNESRGLNFQMTGESESINRKKEQRRLERELLR